jgi:hypothetical protein
MAEDIWTINLECHGAASGQKYVKREMDRDEICYFNLISLIEEYGYQSIDYIYYKRSDSLVAIQLDTEVMEMLKENESKKEITLFVTRQRIAIIEPHFNKGPTKSAPKKTKGSMMKLQFALLCMFQHPSKIYAVLSFVNF